MLIRSSIVPWLVGAIAIAGASSAAFADSTDDEIARNHFATGSTYYEAGRYDEAVREFLEAQRLSHRAGFFYNIGLAYEKLGDLGRATRFFERYLDATPNAQERVEIQSKLFGFSPRVAKLIVRAPARSTVLVDGIAEGDAPLPAPVLLTEGPHVVEARLEGALPARAEVLLKGGLSSEVSLTPSAPAAIVAPAPTQQPASPPSQRRSWVWPVLGVAAAFVVGAAALGLATRSTTDYRASERAGCPSSSCVTIDQFSPAGH